MRSWRVKEKNMTTMELKSKIAAYKSEMEFARQMANDYHRDNNFYDETIWDVIACSFSLLVENLEIILNHRA